MIWPKALAQIAVNKSLHGSEGREDHIPGWKISRHRFFMYCAGGMFLYYVSDDLVNPWCRECRRKRNG